MFGIIKCFSTDSIMQNLVLKNRERECIRLLHGTEYTWQISDIGIITDFPCQ